jgi:2-amino-4-hydroxy-6-hydroxymethyldihydropteridine diphosphokinase
MEKIVILVGLGANLASPDYGLPRRTCEAALAALACAGVGIEARSRWYESAPVPLSGQPWFVNGAARLSTDMGPVALLALFHDIERRFGRARGKPNAARTIDLDLLAHGMRVSEGGDGPILPHPRLAKRAFVLMPLAEVAPGWRHPETGLSVAEMLAAMPAGQAVVRLAEDS